MRNIKQSIIRNARIAMHESNLADCNDDETMNDLPCGANAQSSCFGFFESALRELHDDRWVDHYCATGETLDFNDVPPLPEPDEVEDRSCEKMFGASKVVIEYYPAPDNCNSIHVEREIDGVMFTADISQLTSQCNDDGSKWLEDENEVEGGQMPAGQWKRIDAWLTEQNHY